MADVTPMKTSAEQALSAAYEAVRGTLPGKGGIAALLVEQTGSTGESDIANAERELEFSRIDLEKYIEGDMPQELQSKDEAILLAEAAGRVGRADRDVLVRVVILGGIVAAFGSVIQVVGIADALEVGWWDAFSDESGTGPMMRLLGSLLVVFGLADQLIGDEAESGPVSLPAVLPATSSDVSPTDAAVTATRMAAPTSPLARKRLGKKFGAAILVLRVAALAFWKRREQVTP